MPSNPGVNHRKVNEGLRLGVLKPDDAGTVAISDLPSNPGESREVKKGAPPTSAYPPIAQPWDILYHEYVKDGSMLE